MRGLQWSKREKAVARRAFDAAYKRECEAIMAELRKSASAAKKSEDIWEIHDYLTRQRRTTDEKYDYRYSMLIFVFAQLLKEGWLKEEELEGLCEDKIERIKYLACGEY